MKRFSMQYTSDQVVCGSNRHTWGYASTLKVNGCLWWEADNFVGFWKANNKEV